MMKLKLDLLKVNSLTLIIPKGLIEVIFKIHCTILGALTGICPNKIGEIKFSNTEPFFVDLYFLKQQKESKGNSESKLCNSFGSA